ncbi:MAG: hypothetical protein HUU21_12445 [Polyangiaceae bacterium]|nr:hypothetical protein [Polyangiaceae bacterium]
MGRTVIVGAAVALAAWAVPLSWGQDIDRFMLTEADFRALPPDAREEYLAGTDALNHVDFLAAHAHYRRAAEMAPDSAAMQFKLFELSQHQARLAAGDRRQEDYLVVGQEALQRVAESPVASVEERRRAETQIQFLQRRLSDIESQEAGRREMGRSFLHAYTLEQDWFRVGQRFPAMTRMIATASGAGQALTRSQVVLVNEAGQVFHADMTPFYDENGRHMTQGDMADYTFEAEPDEAFFRGESETASLAPGPAAGSLPPVPRAPAPPPAPRARPREIVKLLWHDAKALPRVRKHPRWRVLLAELELRLLEQGDLDDQEEGGADDADRRDVFEVLARGEPIGADGVGRALDTAIDEDGKLEPPLVLVAGELDLPFDELETLKATATAVSPFAQGDKRLKETLDVVTELLRTPYMAGAGGLAETMTGRLKEAFGAGKRPLPPEALDAHIDRMLLEQRAYQKRAVYGKRWIRALLAPGSHSQVPVYIPEALAGDLPMFRRIKVRMIAEVDLKEDQSESSGHALKVMALGRVTPAG